MANLDLWNAVERTDPAHTKEITGKPYRGNSPKPHYLIHKATETFGPCGIGWGFEIVDEKLLDGALLAPGFFERIHMARVRVWYEWQGKRGSVEHVGQTAFCGQRSGGKPFTDEDAPKKSVTDALVKALSMIGFAGDIFLGRYDDSKYVNEVRREIAEEGREGREGREQAQPDRQPSQSEQAFPGPSKAAQTVAREIKDCRSARDLESLKATPEFKSFWRDADPVDRRFVQDGASAAVARFPRRAA